MNKKPTPVKMPDDLLQEMQTAAAVEHDKNLSAAIRTACRFWLEYRNRQTAAPTPVPVAAAAPQPVEARQEEVQTRLPWLTKEKKTEQPQRAVQAKGMVWKPGK